MDSNINNLVNPPHGDYDEDETILQPPSEDERSGAQEEQQPEQSQDKRSEAEEENAVLIISSDEGDDGEQEQHQQSEELSDSELGEGDDSNDEGSFDEDEEEDMEVDDYSEEEEEEQSIPANRPLQYHQAGSQYYATHATLEDIANAAIDPLFAQLGNSREEQIDNDLDDEEEELDEEAQQDDNAIYPFAEETEEATESSEAPIQPDAVEEPATAEPEPEPSLEVEENDKGEPIEEDQEEQQQEADQQPVVKEHAEVENFVEEPPQTTITEESVVEAQEEMEVDHMEDHLTEPESQEQPSIEEQPFPQQSTSEQPKPASQPSPNPQPTPQAVLTPQQTTTPQDIPTGPVELSEVSAFLQIDTSLIETLDPNVLEKIQAKVREFRALKSEKVVLEVKLEQSSHIANRKVDLFKSQLTKSQDTNRTLKEQITILEKSKLNAQAKLESLESQISQSSSLKFQNQQQFDELHAEKMKTLELLDKKNKEIDNLTTELDQLRNQTSSLRKTAIELETSNQSAQANYVHSNIKIQSLETQIDLINKNNEWLSKELGQITSDFTNYRKDKSTELIKLQSQLDEKTNELNSFNLKYDNLKQRFNEVSTKSDDSLLKIKSLTDELAFNKEEFFKEISIKDRLVELLKNSNEDAKDKIKELENCLHNSNSNVANESAALQTQLNQYKLKLADSESKIESLERTIDELSTSVADETTHSHLQSSSFSTTMKSVVSKIPGTSLSQLYSDFSLMKKQLALERRAKERLQQQIDSFVAELEQKAPLINATKERANLLETELTELSVVLENTTREKEDLQKALSDVNKQLQDDSITIDTLNRQKVDLARQVQTLLCQISVRGDLDGPLTPSEKQALARISKGVFLEEESDTDKLISQRLVTFHSVVELQAKNEDLLRIVRELGAKLENEEKTSKSKLESLENQAILEAKEAILTLQEEITSVESKLNSVTKERDMFRSMLANKPISSGGNLLTADLSNPLGDSKQLSVLTEKYEQAQADVQHFEGQLKQIKVEYETTINLLNKQISDLSSERSELSINLARERSSNELAHERYKSLQENLKYSKSELDEIRKRSQLLQDTLGKQELRTQQITEELIASKSQIESLRSETSNLRAEKQLWKSIEARLNEENSQLIAERSRLNTLLLNVQALEKERESNANESQRRLLEQSKSLETELASVRSKLKESSTDLKTILFQKDSGSRAYQERIDTLRSELSLTREQLIEKKNVADQLQEKVTSLSAKLHTAELTLSTVHQASSTPSTTASSSSQLTVDAMRLTRELEDAKLELQEANASVIKFKSIATATEDALNNITETFDQYKESTSGKISSLEAEKAKSGETITSLNEQLNKITDILSQEKFNAARELQTANAKINILQSKVASSNKLKEQYDAKVALIEESYKQQVAIATEAQQNYDKELQKHAQVSKAVSLLREETAEFKNQIQILTAESNRTKEELNKSRESWESQKTDLEEELRATKERVQDLNTQNQLLYNQIESLTKSTSLVGSSVETETAGNVQELRELITLLRREKEISDAQLDISNRDLQRVRQQYEVTNNELDKAQLELNKLRLQDSEREKLSQEHSALLHEIEQLNILRESNVTLRNELQSNIKRVKELETKLAETIAKAEPLESEVSKLNAELQSKSQEVNLITEEKNRWKQRSQDILSKYDRIDPQEHSQLKVEVESLKAENQELVKASDSDAEKMKEILARFDRVKQEAQDKIFKKGAEVRVASAKLAEVQKELDELKISSKAEIEKLNGQLKNVNDVNEGKASVSTAELSELKAKLEEKDKEIAKLVVLQTKLAEKENEFKALQESQIAKTAQYVSEIDSLKKSLAEKTTATAATVAVTPSVNNEELTKSLSEKENQLQQLLTSSMDESANAEVENLKEQISVKVGELKKLYFSQIVPTQSGAEAEISQLKKTIEEKEKQIQTLKAQESQLTQLKKDMEDKEKQITTLKEHETKLKELIKTNEALTNKVASLTKEVELLKQAESTKGGKGKNQAIVKAKDLEITRQKEDLAKLRSELNKKSQEALKVKDEELKKLRDELSKVRNDLNKKLQEAVKSKTELTKQVETLKSAKSSTPGSANLIVPPVVQINCDDTELKEQIVKIEEKLNAEFKARYDELLEIHKSRIRAPVEERLQQIAESRFKKKEDELDAKIKELSAELEKKNAGVKSTDAELEELKKKSFDEGREATKKEVAMRGKLLQSKIDKLNKEKKELEDSLKKVQDELAQFKAGKSEDAKIEEPAVGQKRPAEDEGDSPEKKAKNE